MIKVIRSPGKYVQGANLYTNAGEYIKDFASKCLVIATPSAHEMATSVFGKSLKEHGIHFVIEKFNRECSKVEINRLKALAEKEGCNGIIGMGGGKAMDTAKAVAFHCKMPVVIAPTIASSDAPCSALSVIYTEEGVFEEYLLLPRNPDLVLVDLSMESMSGVMVCRRIRRRDSMVKLLAMTSFAKETFGFDVAQAGAQGLVSKNDEQEILEGLATVLGGGVYGDFGFVDARASFDQLAHETPKRADLVSNREVQVLDLMSRGLTDLSIAKRLGIKAATVRKHAQSSMQKLNAENRVQAVLKWTGHHTEDGMRRQG